MLTLCSLCERLINTLTDNFRTFVILPTQIQNYLVVYPRHPSGIAIKQCELCTQAIEVERRNLDTPGEERN